MVRLGLYPLVRYIPLSFLRVIAVIFTWIALIFSSLRVHRIIKINLQLAYPHLTDEQRNRLHRKVVKNQLLSGVESLKSWAMPAQWSMQQIRDVHHFEILEQALENPNGVLFIVPHLGTWEMMNAWVAQHKHLTIMYKPIKNKKLNEFILAGRQQLNATLVPTDTQGVKAIFKALKEGGATVILPDHVPQVAGGTVVPFFNIPTLSNTLVTKLASKTKCSIVGLSCIRREDGVGFDIYCEAWDNPDLYSNDAEIATKALNQGLEKMINRFPSHYMWNYKRFKFVPNIDNIYVLGKYKLEQITLKYHSKEELL